MAPPTKLTEDVQHRITLLVRHGNYLTVAAEAAGVHRNTVYAWIERGEADAENDAATIYADFAAMLCRARAEAQASRVAVIQTAAGHGDWKAAAWMLERQYPDQWGPKTEARVEGTFTHSGVEAEMPDVPLGDDRLAAIGDVLRQIGVIDPGPPARGEEHA